MFNHFQWFIKLGENNVLYMINQGSCNPVDCDENCFGEHKKLKNVLAVFVFIYVREAKF